MKKLLILSMIVCSCFALQAQTSKTSTGKSAATTTYTGTGAEIQFDKPTVDFGTLKVGDVKVVTITFTNIGTSRTGAWVYMQISDGATLQTSPFSTRFDSYNAADKTNAFWVEENITTRNKQNAKLVRFL